MNGVNPYSERFPAHRRATELAQNRSLDVAAIQRRLKAEFFNCIYRCRDTIRMSFVSYNAKTNQEVEEHHVIFPELKQVRR